jgi:hypothetical protein
MSTNLVKEDVTGTIDDRPGLLPLVREWVPMTWTFLRKPGCIRTPSSIRTLGNASSEDFSSPQTAGRSKRQIQREVYRGSELEAREVGAIHTMTLINPVSQKARIHLLPLSLLIHSWL